MPVPSPTEVQQHLCPTPIVDQRASVTMSAFSFDDCLVVDPDSYEPFWWLMSKYIPQPVSATRD